MTQPNYHKSTRAYAHRLPFSAAVQVGHTLYLSGQLGTDHTGHLVSGGIAAETKQALTNLREVLEQNGSGMDSVVKCLVMLADMSEWATMNEVYLTFFDPAHLPARSALGASGLALGARVEIECVAVVKKKQAPRKKASPKKKTR